MNTTVRFDHITKKYQLGLTRTSFPSVIANWARRALRKGSDRPQNETLWALRDVSFDLKEGESLALVGGNGAGKTTILKLLANITKPTAGTISTHGKLSALIELGAGFHPDLTGRENIYLNGTILGLSRQEIASHFDEIVDFSEIGRFINTPVKRYSSGMIVRLGFAIAASIEPDILLVDEVLAVGDAAFQQKCLQKIRSLMEKKTSIIFVSHNFYLVQAVCEKALYLEKGQVRHFGETKEVIDMYEQDLHRQRAEKFVSTPSAAADDSNHDQDNPAPVEIERVEIMGVETDGEPVSSKAPLQVRVHYRAVRDLGTVHASVFLIRSDGLTCAMVRTKLDGVPLHINRGSGTIDLTLDPLQLVSGTYFAEAWILNESDSMHITPKAGRSDWFSVKGMGLSYEESSGVFEPRSTWHHQPATGLHPSNGREPITNIEGGEAA